MTEKLKRTHKTSLSDDELIIFDVLFDQYAPINFLHRGEKFSLMFNYPSHDLNANELKCTIEKFVDDGLMKFKLSVIPRDDKIVTNIGLTKNGGNLWEKERAPIWDKFVSDSSYDYKGFWELSIKSPTLSTAKGFLKYAHDSNLYVLLDQKDIEINEIHGEDTTCLIPWKHFETVYEIKARLSPNTETGNRPETNWNLYHQKNLWWRFVDEL